jgi:hypothetical protein
VKDNENGKSKNRIWIQPLWFLFTIGWYVALSLVIPVLIGFWLDLPEQLNSKPLYTLIGFGIGTIVAFWGLFRMLKRYYLEQKQTKDIKKGAIN